MFVLYLKKEMYNYNNGIYCEWKEQDVMRENYRDHLDWEVMEGLKKYNLPEKKQGWITFQEKKHYLLIHSISTYKRTDKGQNFFS